MKTESRPLKRSFFPRLSFGLVSKLSLDTQLPGETQFCQESPDGTRLTQKSAVWLSFWLGWFLFSVYLLSFSGKFHVMDEVAVFAAGNNLAQHGRADINQLIWTNHWTPNPPGIWGRDSNLYTKKAPGISIIAAPLIWLGHTLPGLNAVHVGLLTNALVTAVTAGLLFVWLIDLGLARLASILTTLGYGLCTIAWVYARMFWESSLLALFFLLAVWAAFRATGQATPVGRRVWLLACGAAVAVGLTLRFEAIVATVLIGLYLLWNQAVFQTDEKKPLKPSAFRSPLSTLRFSTDLILYIVPTLLVVLALAWFNLTRYGSLGETGYTQELRFRAPWVGSWGLLFSPGRGLVIYAPLMILLFFGLRPVWRRLPRPYFWLIAVLCLFYWLFYGSWFAWGGTWGWGPRFLLPILPLLMIFVAEPLEWASRPAQGSAKWRLRLARAGLGGLVLASLGVNLLGIAVDFNEHFLRLGRNDNFVFNWSAFPPLGHWRILREGLVDLIWLRSGGDGLSLDWPSLTPPLVLFVLATAALVVAARRPAPRRRLPVLITLGLCLLLTAGLTFQMMRATTRITLGEEQTQADLPALDTLNASAHPGDALLVPMPPFGDVLETSTLLMAYLDQPLPTYAWIESEPRAIQPPERERVWQATHSSARRVWLFERWLTQDDPLSATTARFTQTAFPVQEWWFDRSGRLTLYALAGTSQPPSAVPLSIPFQGGLRLVDFTVWENTVSAGYVLKVRLTWQAPAVEVLAASGLPNESLIAFVHLLNEASPGGNVTQQDRLLLDLQNVARSPLLPGQTLRQGYGLRLPDDLPPGSYPLIAGLYSAATGQRLHRIDGSPDDFSYLGDITVP